MIIKLETSVSFRASGKLLSIQMDLIEQIDESPSFNSVRNWVLKVGYYELHKTKQKANNWVIFLDHSIQVGSAKVFVVYGCRESNLPFDRAIQFKDLEPLIITSRDKWTGEDVAKEIKKLEKKLGKIKYAVGDYNGNLKKGLRLCKIRYIHDITHWLALEIEKYYKTDEQYIALSLKMSEMRSKLTQSKYAHILPPKQRKKAFYQNIKVISDWVIYNLRVVDSKRKKTEKYNEEKKHLMWLKEYQKFINELSMLNSIVNEIEKVVKTNGLSNKTIEKCKEILDQPNLLASEKGKQHKEKLVKYLQEYKQLIPESETLICTSDILESAFGKYKNYLNDNPMACVTNIILCIAAFTSSLNEYDIITALEKTKISDIQKWTKKHIGESVLKKRTAMLSAA